MRARIYCSLMMKVDKILGSVRLLYGRTCGPETSIRTVITNNCDQQYAQQQKRNAKAQGMTELMRDFLNPATFHQGLQDAGIDYYCGVPDSLLKDFCGYVEDTIPRHKHVITANEGAAVALATGYYLAKGKPALVYMQNSGVGNAINPLLSLTHSSVYRIPMLLLVGWRGEPGKKDEPQHNTQGRVTGGILDTVEVPHSILPDYDEGALNILEEAKNKMVRDSTPYCLLVRRQTFKPYMRNHQETMPRFTMTREDALHLVASVINRNDLCVSTTGMLSRELYELRQKNGHGHHQDFLTVGSMGHASMIALGVAKEAQHKQVWCLDGDGSVLMHMGALPIIGNSGANNFRHVIFNNGCHDSVGGQQTVAMEKGTSLASIASASGYKTALEVKNEDELQEGLVTLQSVCGPALLEIKVNSGHRPDVGRPTSEPQHNKKLFMEHIIAH